MKAGELIIREPTNDDCPSWGRVHYQAWMETYPGLVPPEFLKELSSERSVARLFEALSRAFIAVLHQRVVGFVVYSPISEDYVSIQPSSEIKALYVLRDYQSRGIGKALINRAIACLPEKDVVLFVLKGNENAISFYQHLGFSFTGKLVVQHVTGGHLEELEMVYHRP
jgi:ribosomal protein S18 acetylase RimI-like enzyme